MVVTSYRLKAPQKRGSNDIRASLGSFGHVDVHFIRKSVRQVKSRDPICDGEKYTEEVGRFVGSVAFRGERGYTEARATHGRATVSIEAPPSSVEQGPSGKPPIPGQGPEERGPRSRPAAAEPEPHLLGLVAKTTSPAVTFQAAPLFAPGSKGKKLAFATFFALASLDRGRIRETSIASDLFANGNYFRVPDLAHLTAAATIAPPRPFLGTATFRRESADKVSWEGALRVNLPGFGVVPLAGPGTQATMCADSGCQIP